MNEMRIRLSIAAVVSVLLLACFVRGQEQRPLVREVDIAGAERIEIADLLLRDQDGHKVRFYSDLIKDKIVVLSFFYTTCTYVCTRQGTTFSNLQQLLGERLGKDVFLISVTTDPAKDTTARLKTWGKRYDLQPGWTLVTGDTQEMNKLLIPFTGNPAGAGMHLPSTFIGNDKTGRWTSATGIFTPEDLLKAVDSVAQP